MINIKLLIRKIFYFGGLLGLQNLMCIVYTYRTSQWRLVISQRLNSYTWLEATILNCAALETCSVPVFKSSIGSFLISIPTTGISNNLKALTMIHFPVIPKFYLA